jgi:uncharacterized protein (DUF58 family)
MWPEQAELRALQRRARAVADQLRLPFQSRTWRGQAGNWLGAGIGSSIDFQDHRPYLPGDDPRYIDWQAYARTGQYTMKLYREEVSPQVDCVLEVSESMLFDARKRARVFELFFFAVESARQSNAALRVYALCGGERKLIVLDELFALEFSPPPSRAVAPDLTRIPWRQGSLRVLICDLLFPGNPETVLASLRSAKGRAIVFAPFYRAESAPDWAGNVELSDCETSRRRVQHIDNGLLARYRETYARHFDLWKEQARKSGVVIARVEAEPDFSTALQTDALRIGAVEISP